MLTKDVNEHSLRALESRLKNIIIVLDRFRWLLDSFVVEFFTDSHWNKLPTSWRLALDAISGPATLSCLLDPNAAFILPAPEDETRTTNPWPLSLLAFRSTCHALALKRHRSRSPKKEDDRKSSSGNVSQYKYEMEHSYRKHVKPKKQHEIVRLARLIDDVADAGGCDAGVVDFGAGKGHLSRLLSYGYGRRVTCIEAEDGFSCGARKYDGEVEKSLKKKREREKEEGSEAIGLEERQPLAQPRHITLKLHPRMEPDAFREALKEDSRGALTDGEASSVISSSSPTIKAKIGRGGFVIAGLHACGDLSTAMSRLFLQVPEARGLVSVACCYMKLSELAGASCKNVQDRVGYPMSRVVAESPGHQLSYEARELSCHAQEVYVQRLTEDLPRLRLHCHRAALEVLVREADPTLVKPQVRGGKKITSLPFFEYAAASLEKLGLNFVLSEERKREMEGLLDQWQRVVVHYTLRLLLAPLVESCVLLDRVAYLRENGIRNVGIVPVFDPLISPRNFAIVALKGTGKLQ